MERVWRVGVRCDGEGVEDGRVRGVMERVWRVGLQYTVKLLFGGICIPLIPQSHQLPNGLLWGMDQ